MKKRGSKGKLSMQRVEKLVNDLIAYTKQLCPEAEVVEVKIPGHEELDAMVDIVVPDERYEEVHDAVLHREQEIFMNEGYDIAIHILSRSDYEWLMAKMKSLSAG